MTPPTAMIWDVLVIGAGPSGTVAARECARRGLSVLLVDKARFPRAKVCGGCLSHVAVELLKQLNLLPAVIRHHPPALRELDLRISGRRLTLALPEGLVISRTTLDHVLLQEAIDAGATFHSGLSATRLTPATDHAMVHLRQDGNHEASFSAKVVLVATGLTGMDFSNLPALARQVSAGAPIGAGVFIDDPHSFPAGVIHMAASAEGYVGLARVEDGRLDIGAAFNPSVSRQAGGIGKLAAKIITQAGFELPSGLAEAHWSGTPRLTSRPRAVAMGRVLLVGDSAGYVEPFTGEGMSWAMIAGAGVAPLVADHLKSSSKASPYTLDRAWIARHRQLLHRRQWMCHGVTRLLRQPRVAMGAMGVLSRQRMLADWLVRRVHQPVVLEGQ